eukprot:6013528-Pyramimonas_sp.AAC.1
MATTLSLRNAGDYAWSRLRDSYTSAKKHGRLPVDFETLETTHVGFETLAVRLDSAGVDLRAPAPWSPLFGG